MSLPFALAGVCGPSRLDGTMLLGALVLETRQHLFPCLAQAMNLVRAVVSATTCTAMATVSALAAMLPLPGVVLVTAALAALVRLVMVVTEPPDQVAPDAFKPRFFPCTTTHTRFVPTRHHFAYAYLVVGVPVVDTGTSNGMISVAPPSTSPFRRAWFHIEPADYLERGRAHLGLRSKLDAHLREAHGVDPARYPHAYLVTAARFLGFHFNPVSFWYLYDVDRELASMVLEVNNTSDERRMYYVELGRSADDTLFTAEWSKDFHVSPYNLRSGTYRLRTNDPLAPHMTGSGPVSISITLRTRQKRGKMVGRLFSDHTGRFSDHTGRFSDHTGRRAHSLDPDAMSTLDKACFVVRWWCVGLLTVPRILWQAALLFFRRRLAMRTKPQPLANSVCRRADVAETAIESVFRAWLVQRVQASSTPLVVTYTPAGVGTDQPVTLCSADHVDDDAITLTVLTPAFYGRFACYANTADALLSEMHDNATIAIAPATGVAMLVRLLSSPSSSPSSPSSPLPTPGLHRSLAERLAAHAIQCLRRRPARLECLTVFLVPPHGTPPADTATTSSDEAAHPVRPLSTSSASSVRSALSDTPFSTASSSSSVADKHATPACSSSPSSPSELEPALDAFVQSLVGPDTALRVSYHAAMLKLLLADRVALGMVPLLDAQLLALRAVAAWGVAQLMASWL